MHVADIPVGSPDVPGSQSVIVVAYIYWWPDGRIERTATMQWMDGSGQELKKDYITLGPTEIAINAMATKGVVRLPGDSVLTRTWDGNWDSGVDNTAAGRDASRFISDYRWQYNYTNLTGTMLGIPVDISQARVGPALLRGWVRDYAKMAPTP
jgi:hypothetical protein